MPLAWVDEIAGLEPAINFIQGKGYTSKLWPYVGVEEQFLAYLPLQGWLHILFQKALGFSVYKVRLPYALFLVSGAIILYKILRYQKIGILVSLIILVLVLNEKSIFETTRGIRVEPIALLLLSVSFYGVFTENKHLIAISLSFMLLLHPYLWPVALILFLGLNQHARDKGNFIAYLKPNKFWLYPASLILFYLFFIEFDIKLFYSQFLAQANYHQTFGGITGRVYNHFVERFWPYYFTQPYVPVFIYLAFTASIYRIAHRKAIAADVALVFTHICWMLAIGPMHRYNSVLFILSIFTFIPYLSSKYATLSEYSTRRIAVFALLLIISSADVILRQTLALAQRAERNPTSFLYWLDDTIPAGSTIISGHEIAYYHTAYRANQDFFLFNTEPYRFNFNEYDNKLILSYDSLPKGNLISSYSVKEKNMSNWLAKSNSLTYDGVLLYAFSNSAEYFAQLNQLKKRNTIKSNKTKYD